LKKISTIVLLTLTIDFCLAQSVYKDSERLQGVSTVVVKAHNSCGSKKGPRAKFYFNDKGQVIRSKHFFKRQKRAEYEYQYDSSGNEILRIRTYSINHKDRIDTNLTHYVYDSKMRIIKKTEHSPPNYSWTEIYSEFNELNKPKKVLTYSSASTDTIERFREYNSNGHITKIQYQGTDSIITREFRDYNVQGDLVYSLIPSIVGKEDEPLAIWFGGRYAPEERFEYTYNKQNRWTKQYLVYKGEKLLLHKRVYK
jgi:hypothetical protein